MCSPAKNALFFPSQQTGFLHFAGVKINPVSYITLVMSIGLLVDFIIHPLLRYYECKTGTREDRVKEMLRTMGSSILIGGISTFLGIMLLAFSTSTIFGTIFRAFIGMVLLGCGYGLMLLPVVLSMVGPEDNYESRQTSIDETPEKETTDVTTTERLVESNSQENATQTFQPVIKTPTFVTDVWV